MRLTKPVVYPDVWLKIQKNDSLCANNAREHVERRECQGKSNVRQNDVRSFAAAKHSTGGIKVTATEETRGGLLETARSSRDVERQIKEPSKELMEDEWDGLVHGSVLDVFHVKKRLSLVVVGASLGHKGHVFLHMAGEHVMSVVGKLPREVRHHKTWVSEEANDVIQLGVLGESAMTCFMTENPDSGANQALDKAVKCPGSKSQSSIFNARDVTSSRPSKNSDQDHVAD